MDLSIIIPVYNEEQNVNDLYSRLKPVLKQLKKNHEIIFVEDGSTDNTYKALLKIHNKDKTVKIIKFRKNFGQTAALDAGFKHAKGNLIVTMDGDLQNDSNDIPKLIKKLREGYDVVSGWRHKRRDNLPKKMLSLFQRLLRKIIINDKIHDSGCSLKIYKKECLHDLDLHGEMHRYIAEILALRGYKIGEVKVNHLPRKKGKTKYNFIRLPKGFLDLIVIAFWQKYSSRPIHLFGGMGILMSLLGIVTGLYLVYLKFAEGISIANRPLLLLAVLLIVLGIQFIIFGLIADVLVKMYYSGSKKNYYIEKIK